MAAALLAGTTGCGGIEVGGTEATDDWGPLAVLDVHARGGYDAAYGPGSLHIGEDCVTLELGDGAHRSTLIWRAPEVTWDAQAREITFERFGEEGPVRLSDGDRITLGGSGFSGTEADWAAPLAADCPDPKWSVHGVTVWADDEKGGEGVEVEEYN